jgi:hypothetical protein
MLSFFPFFVANKQGFKPYRFIFTMGGGGAIKMVDLQAKPPRFKAGITITCCEKGKRGRLTHFTGGGNKALPI